MIFRFHLFDLINARLRGFSVLTGNYFFKRKGFSIFSSFVNCYSIIFDRFSNEILSICLKVISKEIAKLSLKD